MESENTLTFHNYIETNWSKQHSLGTFYTYTVWLYLIAIIWKFWITVLQRLPDLDMFPYGIFLKPYVMVLMRSVPQRFGYWNTWSLVRGTAWRKAVMQLCWESISLGWDLRVYNLTSLPAHSLDSGVAHQLASCSSSHICPYETMGQSQFFLLPVVLFMVLCYSHSKETSTPIMLMSPRISTRNSSS